MWNKKIQQTLILLISFIFSYSVFAEDRINLKGISIIGNKELPKMLYIVPWKNSELPDMNAPPIERLIDEALAPVDRDSFKRKIRYYQIYSEKVKSENQ
ncbi:MAG: hypothetical protein BMS9Abin31_0336 [Gammaproteobacteria bacterium]|nr:MAG: hypothetical protein BMS9Abin31_0336 [Gammaproteobacteria bacterium]